MTDLLATAASAAQDTRVVETTTKTFVKDVIDESRSRPVLVDFWAPWCGPCRTLGPIIEKAVAATKGAVRLVKMNIDDHPSIAGQLGIQSIPAVIAFRDGQPVDGFIGALPEGQVKAFIDRVAGPTGPSDVEQLITAGERLLGEGDAESAVEAFSQALQLDAQSIPASAGLANALLTNGDTARAREILASLPEKAAKDPRVTAIQAQLDLAEKTAQLGDAAPLEARIAADPKDYQARFDLALVLNAAGDRLGAAEQLLEIVRQNRSWSEEKARTQLLQFFDAWGPMDEATLAGRRRLSSMLFA